MIKLNLKSLTRRTKLFVATGIVLAGTSSVLAFNNFDNSAADIMSPTEVKVNDHETRITKNETDIAETKQRVDEVEQKTDENTQAIAGTTERVVVVERQAAETKQRVEQVQQAQQAAPTPAAPAPAPEPVKPINIRLVIAMTSSERFDRFGGHNGWKCTYTLESGRVIDVLQGVAEPCYQVGQEITSEIANLSGIW